MGDGLGGWCGFLLAEIVGWVKRSDDPTPAAISTCVGSSLTLDPTYASLRGREFAAPWVPGIKPGMTMSPERKRQLAGAADGAFRPGHRPREVELGDALEKLLHRHCHLHACEVRANAAVDAEAEGGVAVLLAVDDHLVGVGEYGGVAVGGGERQQHHLALFEGT